MQFWHRFDTVKGQIICCVRKRGKSWNAQVRISGCRSFTKSFLQKSDAVVWINQLEHKLRSAHIPDFLINTNITLADVLFKYAKEISPLHKGVIAETHRLKSIARSWIGELDIRYLTKQHFIQYRNDRVKVVVIWPCEARNLEMTTRVLLERLELRKPAADA